MATLNRHPVHADHVRELLALHGQAVAVPMEDVGGLWVIGTGNRHYQGAHTAYATSDQVLDLVQAEDYVGGPTNAITDEAAERIAEELTALGASAAAQSAQTMRNPNGHPDSPTGLPGDTGMPGVEWRRRQNTERNQW